MMLKFAIVSFCIFLMSTQVLGKQKYVNETANPGELCNRECLENDRKVCYFKFILEHYHTLGTACKNCSKGVFEDCEHPQCIIGDGVEKGVMSINRMVPGPPIHVCKGDMIIIDVVNNAHGTAAALHWHGMHMRKTPYMDGVPYTTQCPIQFASTFRYSFEALEAGTKFYHSHSGHHKTNGQYGALIIREPNKFVPQINEYDFDLPEHNIVISDWSHDYGENTFPGLVSKLSVPDSLLINGRGSYVDPNTFKMKNVPVTVYFVEPGKRYRFRVINSVSRNCPVQLQIENHTMTVISSDSSDVKPLGVNVLGTNSGERYDFILTANNTKGDFWMKIAAMHPFAESNLYTYALLRYKTVNMTNEDLKARQPPFPSVNTTYPSDIKLNDPLADCLGNSTSYCVTDLTALDSNEELLSKTPDHTFFLGFDIHPQNNEELFRKGNFEHFMTILDDLTGVGGINNISVTFPASPPLTQLKDIDESEFCDSNKKPKHCEGKSLCPCIHVLKVKKNSIVEIIVVDVTNANPIGNHHPFHLHGYNFMVTGLGQHPSGIPMTVDLAKNMERSRSSKLPRNYKNNRPPFKDTVSIPGRGYAVLRFKADNPGFWLMHCHYEWHLSVGMGLIVQVGTPKQMVPAPKGFPKCNNYIPKVKMFK